MKKDIHPKSVDCEVICACGNKFNTVSNKEILKIDTCNECHPFFTNSQKILDSAGRVDKFNKKYKLK